MKKTIFFLLLIILISGCANGTQNITPSPTLDQAGYPTPVDDQEMVETSYPAPEAEAIPLPTWTVDAAKGQVSGVLRLKGKPVANALLFLGTFLKNQDGVDFTAVVEPATSPKAYTDEEGNFIFLNVVPGRYTLIFDNIVAEYLLYKPGTEDYFIIEVARGEKMDMGILDFEDLPIPGN